MSGISTTDAPARCQIAVGVADGSRLFAESLARALGERGLDACVVDCDTDLARYDVLLADVDLPSSQFTRLIRGAESTRGCRLVLVAPRITKATRQAIRETGASAGVDRSTEVEHLIETIHAVARGEQVPLPTPDGPEQGPAALTQRELEILAVIATGATNEKIARQLSISPHTVRSHVGNIMTKLAVSGRVSAVAAVRRAGLIPPQSGRTAAEPR